MRQTRGTGWASAWRGSLAALSCLPAILLAGCGLGQGGQSVDLAVACETEDCSCTADGGFSKKKPPIQWKTDGTAYCPEGYSLYQNPPPSLRWTVGPGLQ